MERNSFRSFKYSPTVNEPIFTKLTSTWQLGEKKNSYAEFHKNLTKHLAAETTSLTGRYHLNTSRPFASCKERLN